MLFDHFVGPSDGVSRAFSDVSLTPNFDDLFGKLKSKIAGLDLLGAIGNNLPILVKVRELVCHLVRQEAPPVIFAFVLDLKILLDQEVSVTNLKRSSTNLLNEKSGALSQQQDVISRSEQQLAYWRARIYDQETLTVLNDNIHT